MRCHKPVISNSTMISLTCDTTDMPTTKLKVSLRKLQGPAEVYHENVATPPSREALKPEDDRSCIGYFLAALSLVPLTDT